MSLKNLGIALLAALVVGGVGASNATAKAVEAEGYWFQNGTKITGNLALTCSIGEHEASKTFVLGSTVGGTETPLELKATGVSCPSGQIFNESNRAKASGKLKFTGVTVVKPAGCSVSGGTIETESLVSQAWMEEGSSTVVFQRFASVSGEALANVSIEGCAIANVYPVKGVIFGEAVYPTGVGVAEQIFTFSGSINSAAGGSLTFGGKAATLKGQSLFSLTGGGSWGLSAPAEPINETDTFGQGNPSAQDLSQCETADPINCASGNQTEEQTDLVVGGRGPALHITRAYNSQGAVAAKEAGPWGYGWSGPYSSHLEINNESGAITVVQENGATASFALSGGKYVAAAWIQSTLAKAGVGYVFTLPDQEKLWFDTEGKLVEQEDRNGDYVELIYLSGKLWVAADAAGRNLLFSYTGSQVTSVEDPMGRKYKYAYESGNLISVTLPGEETPRWKFKYDGSHQLTEMTDGRGGVTKTEYEEKHRVKKQTDPAERVIKFAYGESGGKRTTTITEPNGSTSFEKFNEGGEPLEVIKAKGTGLERKSTYEYTSSFALVRSTDALNHSTIYGYNTAGDLTLEKDPESNETKWTYNTKHDIETETASKGEKTTYKRDASGNVEAIERPAPGETTQKWTFKHSVEGDLETATDPLGHETKFEYDAYGDLKAETDPEGDKTTWTYNKDGEQLTAVSPRGNEEGAKSAEFETVTERDSQGRPIKVTDPLGRETKFAYDKNGNLESTTDALGHTTKITYNADDEQTKSEKANGTTTEIAYDSMGEIKSRTDGNGYTTKYEHDALEQLTETIDPLERKAKREYDAAGNLKKTEDALGRTISYSYDAADRLKEVNYSEEATHDVTYKYDKDGNVVEMTDGTGTTTREYDQIDRLTEVKNGAKEVVHYKYDLGNQQTEITYPNGESVKRGFDKAGRLEKVTDWLGKETTFGYNRDSQVKAMTFPSTTTNVDEYSYDRADQLSEVSMKKKAEVLASMTYTRDKIGQIEKAVETGFAEEPERKYEYDTANRLTKSNGTIFEYDKANNVTKISPTTYTYDKADQIATASNATFEYNKLGQRIKETPSGGSAIPYSYDQAGNLISTKNGSIENTFKYDGSGLRTSETRNASTYPMAWDVTSRLPLQLRAGNDYYIYGPEGLPIEQITSGSATYLHHDQLGSIRVLTNASGESTGTYRYGPNGAVWKHTGTGTSLMGFAGQYRMHTENQLIYLRARTYDPATAQFLSVDPLAATTGEPFGYAGDNPVNRGDPSGLDTYSVCLQGTLGLGGGIFEGSARVCIAVDDHGGAAGTFSLQGEGVISPQSIRTIMQAMTSPGNAWSAIGQAAGEARTALMENSLKGILEALGAEFGGDFVFGHTDKESVADLQGAEAYDSWGVSVFGVRLGFEHSDHGFAVTFGGRRGLGSAGWSWSTSSGGGYTWVGQFAGDRNYCQ